jgi:DNA-binding MarR family transcriptional regulator
MTRVLQGLQARRLVALRPEPRDGRRRRAALTAQGKQRWRTIRQAVLATEARMLSHLDANRQRAVVDVLKMLTACFADGTCCATETLPFVRGGKVG